VCRIYWLYYTSFIAAMKPVNFLPFITLALLQLANAGAVVPRQEIPAEPGLPGSEAPECELSDFVLCIVNLGELPLSITACTNAATDLGKIGSKEFNVTETAVEGADCIVEASMESQDLPEHCGKCASALLQGGSIQGLPAVPAV